jgi:hypothetical protein
LVAGILQILVGFISEAFYVFHAVVYDIKPAAIFNSDHLTDGMTPQSPAKAELSVIGNSFPFY